MNFISMLPLRKYVVSFLLAFAITAALLGGVSVIFSFLPPPAWLLDMIYDYSYLFSAFAASFFCAKASSARGLLTGIFSADIYILLLIILGGLIFKNSVMPLSLIKTFSLSSLSGALGGILGINFK